MPHIIGVDPGLRGAIAVYDPVQNHLVHVFDIPVFTNDALKFEVDLPALALLVDSFAKDAAFAVIERNFARPGQGVTSMFTFGRVTGELSGMIAANYIPIRFVMPSVWKTVMGLSKDKEDSRKRAISLFPLNQDLFSRKRDDGRAEAALLAFFGRRFLGKP